MAAGHKHIPEQETTYLGPKEVRVHSPQGKAVPQSLPMGSGSLLPVQTIQNTMPIVATRKCRKQSRKRNHTADGIPPLQKR